MQMDHILEALVRSIERLIRRTAAVAVCPDPYRPVSNSPAALDLALTVEADAM